MKISNLWFLVALQRAHALRNLAKMEESAPKQETTRAVANVPLDILEKIVKKVHTGI